MVTLAVADRELKRNKLPIRSDRSSPTRARRRDRRCRWAESFAVRAGDWAVVRKAWAARRSPAQEQPTATSSSREPHPCPP